MWTLMKASWKTVLVIPSASPLLIQRTWNLDLDQVAHLQSTQTPGETHSSSSSAPWAATTPTAPSTSWTWYRRGWATLPSLWRSPLCPPPWWGAGRWAPPTLTGGSQPVAMAGPFSHPTGTFTSQENVPASIYKTMTGVIVGLLWHHSGKKFESIWYNVFLFPLVLRKGATITKLGRYLLATGGVKEKKPLKTIEAFDPKRPEKGWKRLEKLEMPAAVSEHCTVTVDGRKGKEVVITGGRKRETRALRLDVKSQR